MTSSWAARSALLVCLVPVVACQASVDRVEPPEPSNDPVSFQVIGDEPVIDPRDYGAAYLLPGAAV